MAARGGADEPAGQTEGAGGTPPVAHEEGPLAEQGVAPDVAEVLQQDAPDEADVKAAHHGQFSQVSVGAAQKAPTRKGTAT